MLTRQEQRRAAGTGGDGCGHTHGENIYFLPGDLASRLSYPFFCLVGFQIYILGSLYGMAGESVEGGVEGRVEGGVEGSVKGGVEGSVEGGDRKSTRLNSSH